jgi:hypothetical protein
MAQLGSSDKSGFVHFHLSELLVGQLVTRGRAVLSRRGSPEPGKLEHLPPRQATNEDNHDDGARRPQKLQRDHALSAYYSGQMGCRYYTFLAVELTDYLPER